MPQALDNVYAQITKANDQLAYCVPAVWTGKNIAKIERTTVRQFFSQQIGEILRQRSAPFSGIKSLSGLDAKSRTRHGAWTKNAVVYNMLPRFFAAFDHDQDGQLGGYSSDHTLNADGIRETGTFLKIIALLPYLKSLGINTIHLLPVTIIGEYGRKGDLGSPYAVKNQFKIDPLLADPVIDADATLQLQALTEAAHIMGIRVVLEFILRTSSIDADWAGSHPNWYYWIKASHKFQQPVFPNEHLKEILKIPEGAGRFHSPPPEYRNLFDTPPPRKAIQRLPNQQWMATGKQDNLTIASAFADWPPNDIQPAWSDVTYLRMFEGNKKKANDFNYISYDTIRYYDPELAKKENINQPLWDALETVIPYYQKKFGIDGAMIDMGHALPDLLKKSTIEKARAIDQDFAFWDENFDNKQDTLKEGYNAVIGNSWYTVTRRNGLKNIVKNGLKSRPLPYFGTAESHNTPRYAVDNMQRKKLAWALFQFLPQAIPFIHNGFELNESLPVNTGLNFNEGQLKTLKDEKLALFYKAAMNWQSNKTIIRFMQRFQQKMATEPAWQTEASLSLVKQENPRVAVLKKTIHGHSVYGIFNLNPSRQEKVEVELPQSTSGYENLLDNKKYPVKQGRLSIRLSRAGFVVIK